ncbi:MAG: hypothetical protein BAJALOKI3v1_430002 [Promethearchaeota archaeon]|nr:MAG: hypothetical protein BAJALOKI3v1_430002 [Candidatus Lokiarchaeota archaeon]
MFTQPELAEILEKVIFDEKELKALKEDLNALSIKDRSDGTILKRFLHYLAGTYEQLLEFIPFHYEQITQRMEISTFAKIKNSADYSSQEISHLQSELEEKDAFLEQIALRIQGIYTRISQDK